MSLASRFPSIKPSLNLDFANTKRLDPRVTFTRASAATYFDAEGVLRTAAANECRFHHNPVSGECLGVYVEPAATNLLTYSEDFSNASWYKIEASVSANQIIAPDGNLGFDAIIESSGNDQHVVYQTLAALAVGTYTLAAVISKTFIGSRNFAVRPFSTGGIGGTAANGVIFNQDGEFVAFLGGGATPTYEVIDEGDRFVVSVTGYTTNVGAAYPSIGLVNGTTASYAGNGTSAMYLWGAQFESGAKRTSYIKTEASTVTRAADVTNMAGTNFSSWYNSFKGTMVWEGVSIFGAASSNQRLFSIRSDDDAYSFNATLQTVYVDAGKRGLSVAVTGVPGKFAMAADMTQIAASVNGGTVGTFTGTAEFRDSNSLTLGYFSADGTGFAGTIKRLAFYPDDLPGNLQVLAA